MALAAKPLILWDNFIARYLIASITSEAAGFPKENLYDGRVYTAWKMTSTATQNIRVDLGAARTVEAFAVLQHLLGTQTVTVTITSTANADYTTSAVTHKTISFTEDTNYWVRMDTTNFSRYVQIALTSIGAVFTIGEMFLGPVYELPVRPMDGFDMDRQQAFGRTNRSRGGHMLGSTIMHTDRIIEGEFHNLSEAQAQTYKDFWEDHGGQLKPFLYVPDETNYATRFYQLVMDNDPELSLPSEAMLRHISGFRASGIRLTNW